MINIENNHVTTEGDVRDILTDYAVITSIVFRQVTEQLENPYEVMKDVFMIGISDETDEVIEEQADEK